MQTTTRPPLEMVLLDYIEKYGLTDQAKQYFKSNDTSLDASSLSQRNLESGNTFGDIFRG